MNPIPILISGAPRSGKDTLAREILETCRSEGLRVSQDAVARPLKAATHAAFAALHGIPAEQVPEWDAFEVVKDEPCAFFAGISPREAYIRFHEDLVKPHLGNTFFADMVSDEIRQLVADIVVVADIGNYQEAIRFPPGVLVHCDRDGATWDNRRPIAERGGKHRHVEYTSCTDLPLIRRFVKTQLLPAAFLG